MSDERDVSAPRARSKSYPAISLRQAVARCQTLYDRDGWTPSLAETAATHWGFGGLNGGSRPILSALKQFGLIEYVGSGDTLKVKLTDLAKRILRPMQPEERTLAISEAMVKPKLYASLHENFSDWRLPSDATLSARLEREEGIQPRALKELVADIRDSVAYLSDTASAVSATGSVASEAAVDADSGHSDQLSFKTVPDSPLASSTGLQTYPMPGGEAYVCLPKTMTPEEATRAKRWMEKVIIPAIEFAGDLEATGS